MKMNFYSCCKKPNRRLTHHVVQYGEYEVILPRSNFVQNWIKITDDKGKDRTEELKKFAGPNKDFFNVKVNINNMSRSSKTLTFEYPNEEKLVFNGYVFFEDCKKEK